MTVHVTVELSIKYLLVLALILQTLSYFRHSGIVVQIVCFGLSKGTLFIQFRMLSVMHTNLKKIHQILPSGLDKLLQGCSGPSGKYILWTHTSVKRKLFTQEMLFQYTKLMCI